MNKPIGNRSSLRSRQWMWGACILLLGSVILLAFFYLSGSPQDARQVPVQGSAAAGSNSRNLETPSVSTVHSAQSETLSVSASGAPDAVDSHDVTEVGQEALVALGIVDGDARHSAFIKLIEKMRPEDALSIRNALLYYDKLGKNLSFEWQLFWRKWGAIDPGAALAHTKDEPASRRANMYQNIFYSLSRDKPADAVTWLNSNTKDPNYKDAFLSFVDGYSISNLADATNVSLASLTPDDPLLPKVLAKLADAAFNIGSVDRLKSWFDQLPTDNKVRSLAMNGIYPKLVRMNAADAAQWVSMQSLTPWRNDSAIGYTAFGYAKQDPQAAAEWIASLPPASRPGQPIQPLIGIPEMATNWLAKDPKAFSAWLQNQADTNPNMYQQTMNWVAKLLPANSPLRPMFPGLPAAPAAKPGTKPAAKG